MSACEQPQPNEAALAGADLALAVARVMGLRAMRAVRLTHDTVRLVEPLMDHNGDTYDTPTHEWRPDLGGADAWAVHQWARAQGYDVHSWTEHGRHGCSLEFSDTCEPCCQRIGDTDAIALCRAVVQMRRLTEASS